jgi:propionyl-CoA synthetase
MIGASSRPALGPPSACRYWRPTRSTFKGQVPLGLFVLKAGVVRPAEEVEREAVQLVRDRVGPVASFKTALVVAGLPKTRSGKILRGTMRKIADGEDYPLPATIDDPAVLGEIDKALAKIGYGGNQCP